MVSRVELLFLRIRQPLKGWLKIRIGLFKEPYFSMGRTMNTIDMHLCNG